MDKPIRIAIMGTGFVRRLHLEGLRRVGSAVEVRGLATAELDQGNLWSVGLCLAKTSYTRKVNDFGLFR